MNIDFIRGITAHVSGAAVAIIGLLAIVWLTANGTVAPEVGIPAIVALATAGGNFVWQAETAKQAAKQAERNILQAPPEPPQP